MSEILYIIALSLGSIIAIFILTKIMGYRQMSQMSMFDYIISITIGSIAAEMSTALDKNFAQPLTAMIVYALSAVLLSWISSKSIRIRRVVEGKPLVLLNNGELYLGNLKRAKIDVSEFLEQCRVSGYFDVSKLETAVLEANGKISFLPKSADRPMTPSDMNLSPQQDFMVANVIVDGKVMKENLRQGVMLWIPMFFMMAVTFTALTMTIISLGTALTTTGLSLGNTMQLIFAVLLLGLGVIVAIQGVKKLTEKPEAEKAA